LQSSNNRRWFAVPKPLDSRRDNFRNAQWHWRLSFYEYEKDILSKENNGRAKPIIRHLKVNSIKNINNNVI
jgi:hypothetical protein